MLMSTMATTKVMNVPATKALSWLLKRSVRLFFSAVSAFTTASATPAALAVSMAFSSAGFASSKPLAAARKPMLGLGCQIF